MKYAIFVAVTMTVLFLTGYQVLSMDDVKKTKESMEMQKQLIENVFESWRNDFEQIDDVCVIGVRI